MAEAGATNVAAGLTEQIVRLGVEAGSPTAVETGGLVAWSVAEVGEGLGAEITAATATLYLAFRAASYFCCSPKRGARP